MRKHFGGGAIGLKLAPRKTLLVGEMGRSRAVPLQFPLFDCGSMRRTEESVGEPREEAHSG